MRIKLTSNLIKFAYKFVDVEATGDTAIPDERMIEYSFALSHLLESGNTALRILDVGCVARINPLPATLCQMGYQVWGLDNRVFKYVHPNFKFIKDDIRHTTFEDKFFDVINAISTVEHIGIVGRYDINYSDLRGDIKAIEEIRRILKDDGKLLITLPCGKTDRKNIMGRVYDNVALRELLDDWDIIEANYCYRNKDGYLECSSDIRSGDHGIVCIEAKKKLVSS